MSERPDEATRRWFKRVARDAEAIERAAKVRADGLGEGRLEALLDFVDEQLQATGCDHGRPHAARWLELHGVPVEPALDLLSDLGGRCDCMIVMNVVPDEAPAAPLAISPPRDRSPPVPRPTRYEDAVLRWELPRKPWRADATPRDALVVLRFGKAAVLRLLDDPPRAGAEVAWVQQRWTTTRACPERFLGPVRGPERVELGAGLTGRRWRAEARWHQGLLLCTVLDVAAPRVLELETNVQREASDLRAVAEATRGLARAT